ncbi:dephospho-CoA kinase [Candidatus Peregrinibacteria bacterium]|nr:dephospho-CoA kinase [Candidatus Peregrinibacteria bacterium]
MIIGIFGKIGSGKTTLALQKKHDEREMRWKIFEVDEIGRKMLKRREIKKQILQSFPDENIWTDHEIDRKKLAEVVLSDIRKLRVLEKILHPKVKIVLETEVKRARKNGENVLIPCALPQKIDLGNLCDEIIMLRVSEKEAWKRLKETRGLSQKIFRILWKVQDSLYG